MDQVYQGMKHFHLLFCCLLGFQFLSSQDFHFANSLLVPQTLNPGATGSGYLHKTQVTVMQRGQWENITTEDAYEGVAVQADMRFCLQNSRKNFYAVGVSAQHDFSTLGGFYNANVALITAYHQHLGDETFIAAGLSLGGLAYGIRERKLKFNEQFRNGYYSPTFDNGESFDERNNFQLDLGAGIYFYNNDQGWSVGMAWKHLNQPLYTLLDEDNSLGPSFLLHGGLSLLHSSKRKPGLILRGMLRRQSFSGNNSKQWQALAGPFFQIQLPDTKDTHLDFGCYLRTGAATKSSFRANTIVPSLRMSTQRFSFMLSYDADLEKTKTRFAGGMELMFSYSFGQRDRCVVCAGF